MKLFVSQRVPTTYDRATWVDIVRQLEQQENRHAEGRVDARHAAVGTKPTTGTHAQGDLIWNETPDTGEPSFWRCTVSGSPGTLEAERKRGTFTMDAAATKTIADTDVRANSVIVLMPTNLAAGTLMGSVKSLAVTTRTAGTSFVVSTADGLAAAGTETFEYLILN